MYMNTDRLKITRCFNFTNKTSLSTRWLAALNYFGGNSGGSTDLGAGTLERGKWEVLCSCTEHYQKCRSTSAVSKRRSTSALLALFFELTLDHWCALEMYSDHTNLVTNTFVTASRLCPPPPRVKNVSSAKTSQKVNLSRREEFLEKFHMTNRLCDT